MVIIGVAGGSGTGKSTVTKFLNEKICDCVTINLDDYMRKYCNKHRDEIISKLKLNIGEGHWSTHLVNNYDDIKKWVGIIESDIEISVRKIISENRNCANVIILDWAFLPLLPIYNECDFSILVKCDMDIKLDRLTERLEKNSKLDKWNHALLQRLKNTALDEFGHSATYFTSNNGSLEELEDSIDCILDNYKKHFNL